MIDIINRVLNEEQVLENTVVRYPVSLILTEDK